MSSVSVSSASSTHLPLLQPPTFLFPLSWSRQLLSFSFGAAPFRHVGVAVLALAIVIRLEISPRDQVARASVNQFVECSERRSVSPSVRPSNTSACVRRGRRVASFHPILLCVALRKSESNSIWTNIGSLQSQSTRLSRSLRAQVALRSIIQFIPSIPFCVSAVYERASQRINEKKETDTCGATKASQQQQRLLLRKESSSRSKPLLPSFLDGLNSRYSLPGLILPQLHTFLFSSCSLCFRRQSAPVCLPACLPACLPFLCSVCVRECSRLSFRWCVSLFEFQQRIEAYNVDFEQLPDLSE